MQLDQIEERTQAWAEGQGLAVARGPHCPRRLHGGRHQAVGCNCSAGWADHGLLLERDGRPVAFAAEPYGIDAAALGALVAYARQHDLKLAISAGAVREGTVLVRLTPRAG